MIISTKKTKIVATIGPATESQAQLEKLLKAGLNVIRMNFSHGDFSEHQTKFDNGKKASEKTGLPVAFLQDLSGPKIRIGTFYDDADKRITLKKGQKFTLTTRKVKGDETIAEINYPKFHKEVKKGETVLLDDGKKRLEILEIKGQDVVCKVIVGGETKGRRGVNLPESDLSISALTDKDKEDVKFGIKNKVDFIAFSFVRKPEEVTELRNILNKNKSTAQIISKIETPQAVEHIDEIIELSDGIMVARGDLAVEVPAEQVPLIQKRIIQKCNAAGKPVITATQMLESMIKSPVPTRAEVSDIANAILDGTDAVMLSEETTLGEFPVESVEVMSRVAVHTEEEYLGETFLEDSVADIWSTTRAITEGAVHAADEVEARYIVCLTQSGRTARMISRFKPFQPIIAVTPEQVTFNQLQLSSGVSTLLIPRTQNFDEVLKVIRETLKKNKLVKAGDKIVLVSGTPFAKAVSTNMMVIEKF